MAYWLFKSEPETFSIDDLKNRPNQTEPWDGVRNYQARNFLRDQVQINDKVLFYHSNCKVPGIVGIAQVVKAGYPDSSAWDAKSPYFDAKSTKDKPRWYRVDVRFEKKFDRIIRLQEIKQNPVLQGMQIAKKGNRLSITPLTKAEWNEVIKVALR